MRNLYLSLLSLLPSVIILLFIYLTDKEKEPNKLLIKLFLGGIASSLLTLFISFFLEILVPGLSKISPEKLIKYPIFQFIYCIVKIALIEEGSKLFFNYNIVWNSKEFDELYDSIVYSVFVSLGFAAFENVFYVLNGGISSLILRSITSVPAHASFGIIMGYYLGLSKLTSINNNLKLSKKYKFLSLALPVLVHGFYDFCLYSSNVLSLLIFIGFLIFIYVGAIEKIKQFKRVKINL